MKMIPLILFAILFLGCQPRLEYQPKLKTYSDTNFYPDHSVARPLPFDTVPFHHVKSGTVPKNSLDLLRQGQRDFVVYCSVCHGLDGRGQGMAVLRGFPRAPSFLLDSLKKKSLQKIVEVENAGTGEMKGFKDRLNASDEWAIALYLRALQYSQSPGVMK